jgi:hypothetical protein
MCGWLVSLTACQAQHLPVARLIISTDDDLGPHDVLVLWIVTSGPDTTGLPDAMSLAPGTPATFGSHAAKVAVGPASSDCGSVGAQYAISAVIARTPPPVHSTVLVTACLGSDESAERAEVMAMLATLQVTH